MSTYDNVRSRSARSLHRASPKASVLFTTAAALTIIAVLCLACHVSAVVVTEVKWGGLYDSVNDEFQPVAGFVADANVGSVGPGQHKLPSSGETLKVQFSDGGGTHIVLSTMATTGFTAGTAPDSNNGWIRFRFTSGPAKKGHEMDMNNQSKCKMGLSFFGEDSTKCRLTDVPDPVAYICGVEIVAGRDDGNDNTDLKIDVVFQNYQNQAYNPYTSASNGIPNPPFVLGTIDLSAATKADPVKCADFPVIDDYLTSSSQDGGQQAYSQTRTGVKGGLRGAYSGSALGTWGLWLFPYGPGAAMTQKIAIDHVKLDIRSCSTCDCVPTPAPSPTPSPSPTPRPEVKWDGLFDSVNDEFKPTDSVPPASVTSVGVGARKFLAVGETSNIELYDGGGTHIVMGSSATSGFTAGTNPENNNGWIRFLFTSGPAKKGHEKDMNNQSKCKMGLAFFGEDTTKCRLIDVPDPVAYICGVEIVAGRDDGNDNTDLKIDVVFQNYQNQNYNPYTSASNSIPSTPVVVGTIDLSAATKADPVIFTRTQADFPVIDDYLTSSSQDVGQQAYSQTRTGVKGGLRGAYSGSGLGTWGLWLFPYGVGAAKTEKIAIDYVELDIRSCSTCDCIEGPAVSEAQIAEPSPSPTPDSEASAPYTPTPHPNPIDESEASFTPRPDPPSATPTPSPTPTPTPTPSVVVTEVKWDGLYDSVEDEFQPAAGFVADIDANVGSVGLGQHKLPYQGETLNIQFYNGSGTHIVLGSSATSGFTAGTNPENNNGWIRFLFTNGPAKKGHHEDLNAPGRCKMGLSFFGEDSTKCRLTDVPDPVAYICGVEIVAGREDGNTNTDLKIDVVFQNYQNRNYNPYTSASNSIPSSPVHLGTIDLTVATKADPVMCADFPVIDDYLTSSSQDGGQQAYSQTRTGVKGGLRGAYSGSALGTWGLWLFPYGTGAAMTQRIAIDHVKLDIRSCSTCDCVEATPSPTPTPPPPPPQNCYRPPESARLTMKYKISCPPNVTIARVEPVDVTVNGDVRRLCGAQMPDLRYLIVGNWSDARVNFTQQPRPGTFVPVHTDTAPTSRDWINAGFDVPAPADGFRVRIDIDNPTDAGPEGSCSFGLIVREPGPPLCPGTCPKPVIALPVDPATCSARIPDARQNLTLPAPECIPPMAVSTADYVMESGDPSVHPGGQWALAGPPPYVKEARIRHSRFPDGPFCPLRFVAHIPPEPRVSWIPSLLFGAGALSASAVGALDLGPSPQPADWARRFQATVDGPCAGSSVLLRHCRPRVRVEMNAKLGLAGPDVGPSGNFTFAPGRRAWELQLSQAAPASVLGDFSREVPDHYLALPAANDFT
eukprot:tig00021489_g21652.t1